MKRASRLAAHFLLLSALLPGVAMQAHAQANRIANSSFDIDLSGWTRLDDRPAEWVDEDGLNHSSGSAVLTHDAAIASSNYIILTQCVPITEPGVYRISGFIRNLPDQAVPGNASIIVNAARNADCTGDFATATGPAASPTSNWQYREADFLISHDGPSWSPQAIRIGLAISKPQAVTTPRRAQFDYIRLSRLDDPAPPITISALISPEGAGTVASAPDGISLPGAAASAAFPLGTRLTLEAAPQEGYAFERWEGACAHAVSFCTFYAEQAATATAYFSSASIERRLSLILAGTGTGKVVSQPVGIDCPGNCNADFDDGTAVTLTATADSTATFGGWSGACTGNASTCVVSMTQDRSQTASFDGGSLPSHALSISVAGNGRVTSMPTGIDCPGVCTTLFDHGTKVMLTHVSAPDWTFEQWSGSCSGTGACSVTMSQARTVDALFQPTAIDSAIFADGFEP